MTDHIKALLARVAAARSTGPLQQHPATSARPAPEHSLQRGLASIEREIAGEIAYSLGKAGRLLADAIEQARATRTRLESGPCATLERAALLERFEQQRALAERRLRYLLIQREALGFRDHADVKRQYIIPPALPSE